MPTNAYMLHRSRLYADCAMAIALSAVLGQIRLLQLPLGGSVTLALVPIVVIALLHGFRSGVVVGLGSGAMQAILGGSVIHPAQYLLDYGLAWGALALVALAPRTTDGIRLGITVACAMQLLVFTVSGVWFWGPYLGTDHTLAYSLGYNAMHVVPEAVITMAVLPLAFRAWVRGAPVPEPVC